jgi:RNA polymerase sigma factor (sigma-70 family)
MKPKSTAIKDVVPSLSKRYPELAELLDDLDGFCKFICIRLRNFKLDGRYSPDDIIGECILRWHQAVQNGKPIPYIMGWMKVTANYVVQELKRESNKAYPYDPSIVETLPDTSDVDGLETIEQRQVVLKALAALPEDKRELLNLRFFQNLSWDAIAEVYVARGENVKASALRKRGQRAQEELRKVFLGLLQE